MTCQMRDCAQSRFCPAPAACGLTPRPQLRPVRVVRIASQAPRASRIRQALWPLEREWRLFQLRWHKADMHPLHPGLPTVLQEMSDIEHRDTPPVTVDMAQTWAFVLLAILAASFVGMVLYGLSRL
jgi:hypothetical protein